MTILALVVIALAPSLVVLAGGASLAAFRVISVRRACPRPARGVGERPDSSSVAARD